MLEPGRSRGWAATTTVVVLLAPTLAAAWALARRQGFPSGGASRPRRSRASQATILSLVVLFALPFAGEAARRIWAGHCAMAEITLLAALRNLGLGLAALSYMSAYGRLSAVVSLFLVTVASSIGGEAGIAVLAPLCGFAVAGTLWLMLVYWKGLGPGADAGTEARGFRCRAWPGCWGRRHARRRLRRWGLHGRPPRSRAWYRRRAAPTGATPTPDRESATATTRSAPASTPNRSGSPRARSTWRPTGPASTTPSTNRTASRSSPRSWRR